MAVITFFVNLGRIRHTVDNNLMEFANKKIKRHLQFFREGWRELEKEPRIRKLEMAATSAAYLPIGTRSRAHLSN